jgi:hypothetical protein
MKMKTSPKTKPSTQTELMARRGKLVTIPTISTHPKAINQAAYTIMSSDTLRDDMLVFGNLREGNSNFFEFFSQLRRCAMIADPPLDFVGSPYHSSRSQHYVGKLGLKDEPAGKVRVFAMVDC